MLTVKNNTPASLVSIDFKIVLETRNMNIEPLGRDYQMIKLGLFQEI
jgi:hypothetical protein